MDKDEDRLDNNNNNTIHSSGLGCNKEGNTIIDFSLISQSFFSQVLEREKERGDVCHHRSRDAGVMSLCADCPGTNISKIYFCCQFDLIVLLS